jgi:hypothetical protein
MVLPFDVGDFLDLKRFVRIFNLDANRYSRVWSAKERSCRAMRAIRANAYVNLRCVCEQRVTGGSDTPQVCHLDYYV